MRPFHALDGHFRISESNTTQTNDNNNHTKRAVADRSTPWITIKPIHLRHFARATVHNAASTQVSGHEQQFYSNAILLCHRSYLCIADMCENIIIIAALLAPQIASKRIRGMIRYTRRGHARSAHTNEPICTRIICINWLFALTIAKACGSAVHVTWFDNIKLTRTPSSSF